MSSPLLSSDNFIMKESLGTGNYGAVNRIITQIYDPVLNKIVPKEYALKQISIKKFRIGEQKEALESAKKEYEILSINHPPLLDNVVKAFGSHHDQKNDIFMFTMELFPQNLKSLAEKRIGNSGIPFDEYLPLLYDISNGINSLMTKKFAVHQDLKPENILVKDGRAVLADVGVAKSFTNQNSLKKPRHLTTVAGTDKWMAPEMLNQDLIKLGNDMEGGNDIVFSKLDIFSLGLISLFCLDSPGNFDKIYKTGFLLNRNSNKLHEEYLSLLKPRLPIEFYCLFKSMLSFDWNARPTTEDIMQFIEKYFESKTKIRELETQNQTLNEEIEKLRIESKKKIDRLKRKIKTQVIKIKKKDENIKAKKLTVKNLRRSNDELKTQNQTLIEKLEKMRAEEFEAINIEPKAELANALPKDVELKIKKIGNIKKGLALMKDAKAKELDLSCLERNKEVTDNGLLLVCQRLADLQQLSKLTLWANGTSITDEGVKYASSAISAMKQLEYLDFWINVNKTTDEALRYISAGIGSLSKLSYLNIGIGGNISDGGVKALANGIKNHLTLKELYFSIIHDPAPILSDASLESVAAAAGNLKMLETLYLDLEFIKNITDECKSLLVNPLKGLMILRKFIFLASGTQFTIKGKDFVTTALRGNNKNLFIDIDLDSSYTHVNPYLKAGSNPLPSNTL